MGFLTLTFGTAGQDKSNFIDAGTLGKSAQLTAADPGATGRVRLGLAEHRVDWLVIFCPLASSEFVRGSLKSAQLSRCSPRLMFW
jgi:hypothetical protein